MDHSHPSIEELLIDYELGQLDEAQRSIVESALSASTELQARQTRMREAFVGLDGWSLPAAPTYLVSRVLARVAAAESDETTKPAAWPNPSFGPALGGPILTLRELVAIAACITLFVGVFVPAGVKARNIAWRMECSQRLRTFAAGLAAYAQDFRGQLPSAGAKPGAYWAKGPVGVERTSNTRHAYLPVKLGYVNDPACLICPSRPEGRPMVADDYAAFDDVAEKANFTFAFQNMGAGQPMRLAAHPRLPIMADANPIFDDSAAHRLSAYPRDANSVNHDREDGQNVLFCDGSVAWASSPNVGVGQDNIWTPSGHANVAKVPGYAVPITLTDTFLINSQ